MGRVAACALAAGVALMGAACGASGGTAAGQPSTLRAYVAPVAVSNRGSNIASGPFVLGGGFAGGSGSGLSGDGASGPEGMHLGCVDGRRYTYAFGIKNRSEATVVVTGVRGANPAPRFIDRVAVQLRLSPPPGDHLTGGDLVFRQWSAAPAKPVTLPPGRIVTVQSDFLMRHCKDLTSDQTVVVPGSFVLTYQAGGYPHHNEIADSGARIILRRGPTVRACTPVAGSVNLVAADTGCTVARQAAPACYPMSHNSWGDCTVAGVLWDCGSTAGPGYPYRELCDVPSKKVRWFRVRWKPPVLSSQAIGDVRLGLPRMQAVAALSKLLGTRSQRPPENTGCGPAYTEVAWQHLYVEFRHGRLSGFRYIEDGWPLNRPGAHSSTSDLPPLSTAHQIRLGSTLGQARAAYGHLQPVGTSRWQTPTGLILYDNARHSPDPPSSRIIEIKYGTCGDF